MKQFFSRFLFLLLSTTIMVFFSEKAYWYVQGYAILELVLFYAAPVAACLWMMDHYRVRDLPGVVLVGALYGFLVEGVLTPVIYEAGLLDPVMPAYFIGWHGLLSVVFGWFLIRRWLQNRQWKNLLASSLIFGLFWGVWSLTFRLPENIAEFEALAAAGETVRPGIWPVEDFALFSLVFAGMLMISHWLLGRGGWQGSFRLSTWERIVLIVILGGLFGLLVLPVLPFAFLKLGFLIGMVLLPLEINKRHQQPGSLLADLNGKVSFVHTLPLLAMPAAATLVYWVASLFPPQITTLALLGEMIPILQSLIGGVNYLLAAGALILRGDHSPDPNLISNPY